jgi:hypothetical protein
MKNEKTPLEIANEESNAALEAVLVLTRELPILQAQKINEAVLRYGICSRKWAREMVKEAHNL